MFRKLSFYHFCKFIVDMQKFRLQKIDRTIMNEIINKCNKVMRSTNTSYGGRLPNIKQNQIKTIGR